MHIHSYTEMYQLPRITATSDLGRRLAALQLSLASPCSLPLQRQWLVQVRTDRVRHQLVLLRGVRPVPDPLSVEQHRSRLRADAENRYVLQFRGNMEPARPGDRYLIFRCREGKGPTRAGRAADSIVDIGRSMSDALGSLRNKKRVRPLACLLDRVCRCGVQQNS